MAKFFGELPNDLIKEFEDLETNAEIMMGKMCKVGAEVVHNKVVANMENSFDSTKSLMKGLRVTRVYKTPTDDGINVHIGFYGYDTEKSTNQFPGGVPIPLIAMAREYGTSSGEEEKPFLRKSFKKSEIEKAMMEVQKQYIKGD